MQKVVGGSVPLGLTLLRLSRCDRISFRGETSALHMEVTHQNDCTAAVPKLVYFKNSLTGYGYEILVPFFSVVV